MLLYRKHGFPEKLELVICTVTKVLHNSVFVNLDEYNRSGMIHISEIAPGRIRNIRDYVKEGKVVVCKVLKVDEQKGHIDLSLRRVSEIQRKEKLNEMKQEQLAEKIIEFAAKKLNKDFKQLYFEITDNVFEKYETLYKFFESFVSGNIKLNDFIKDKKIIPLLEDLIHKRIKPKEVEIKGIIKLKTYESNGVEIIKKIFSSIQKKAEIVYFGSSKYHISIKAKDYKIAEKELQKVKDKLDKEFDKIDGNYEFIRDEK